MSRALVAVQAPGRFGERKVFTSALWSEMCRLDTAEGSPLTHRRTLQHFQRWLFASLDLTDDGTGTGAPLVVLARADLVAAMDPALVAASEWQVDGATYHFVIDRAADPAAYAPRRLARAPARALLPERVGTRRTTGG